jgi:hypothetical protein
VDGPVVVDVAAQGWAAAPIGAVGLEAGVAGAADRLLGPLAGDDEGAFAREALLVAQGRGGDVDLQRAAAPARLQAGSELGKRRRVPILPLPPPAWPRVPSGRSKITDAVLGARVLEHNVDVVRYSP